MEPVKINIEKDMPLISLSWENINVFNLSFCFFLTLFHVNSSLTILGNGFYMLARYIHRLKRPATGQYAKVKVLSQSI